MGQQFGLGLADLGKAHLQHLSNALMVLLPRAPQQGLIGRVLDQGMLEEVRRLGRQTLLIQELRLHQLLQPLSQGPLVPWRDGLQQLVGKLAPQRRPELCQAFHRGQAVQPRHQRVVQRGRNRQRGEEPGQLIALGLLLEQAGLQHHLRQLFDKQRHPIGLGHDLLDDLRGQGLAVGDLADHLHGLALGQPVQRDLGEVRAPRPGRAEVGPKGPQRQDAGGGALIDQEGEQLQGGRIDPVQVFHHKEHRLLGGNAQQDRQQGVQGLLLLLLGRHGQGRIVSVSGRERSAAKRGTASASGRPYCTRNPSSLRSFCCGDSSRSKRSATRSSRSIMGYKAVC